MKSLIFTTEKVQLDIADEVMSFTLKVGTALSALIGVWAVSCLVSALINVGPLQMIKGYVTALTGF